MDRRIVVLGLGNLLGRDEGLGVWALAALQARLGERQGVEWLDGGVLGLSLLPIVEAASHLLVLDAVCTGQPAGSMVELQDEEIPMRAGLRLSEHQVTFMDVLGMAKVRHRLPDHVHLIGVEPATRCIGLELSPEVASSIPAILARAVDVLHGWGVEVPMAEPEG